MKECRLKMPLFPALILMALLTLMAASCARRAETIRIEDSNARVVKAVTHATAVGLGDILKSAGDETRRIEIIRAFIDPIRFFEDESGYFFVYTSKNFCIAHAMDKTLLDKDLSGLQDMKGTFIGNELYKMAQKGGGYVTFYWPHPETKNEQRKIGYAELIPDTDYYIGTGYYPDTK